jgi:hypothetical protein
MDALNFIETSHDRAGRMHEAVQSVDVLAFHIAEAARKDPKAELLKMRRPDLLEGFQKIFPHLRGFNDWIDEDPNGSCLDHYAFDIKKQFKEGGVLPHPDLLHPSTSKPRFFLFLLLFPPPPPIWSPVPSILAASIYDVRLSMLSCDW